MPGILCFARSSYALPPPILSAAIPTSPQKRTHWNESDPHTGIQCCPTWAHGPEHAKGPDLLVSPGMASQRSYATAGILLVELDLGPDSQNTNVVG